MTNTVLDDLEDVLRATCALDESFCAKNNPEDHLAALRSLRAEVAELRGVLDKAAIYVSRSGACSNAPDGDPWDGYCDEPGCDYCDMARATQAALDKEPTP